MFTADFSVVRITCRKRLTLNSPNLLKQHLWEPVLGNFHQVLQESSVPLKGLGLHTLTQDLVHQSPGREHLPHTKNTVPGVKGNIRWSATASFSVLTELTLLIGEEREYSALGNQKVSEEKKNVAFCGYD